MSAIVLRNIRGTPVGAITQFAATIGSSLTHIAGVQHTAFGRYLSATTNSLQGGVPSGSAATWNLFAASVNFLASYPPAKYSPVAGAVNGAIEPCELGAYRLRRIGRLMDGIQTAQIGPFILIVSTT
jgi:hypothetical protein